MDQPSRLIDQLLRLRGAGFAEVDCFWLEAGHAIYGGFKKDAGSGHIDYITALRAAGAALAI